MPYVAMTISIKKLYIYCKSRNEKEESVLEAGVTFSLLLPDIFITISTHFNSGALPFYTPPPRLSFSIITSDAPKRRTFSLHEKH